MLYKNVSEEVLRFRANNKEGVKEVFELKPGEEMESDRIVSFSGLELTQKKVKIKKEVE